MAFDCFQSSCNAFLKLAKKYLQLIWKAVKPLKIILNPSKTPGRPRDALIRLGTPVTPLKLTWKPMKIPKNPLKCLPKYSSEIPLKLTGKHVKPLLKWSETHLNSWNCWNLAETSFWDALKCTMNPHETSGGPVKPPTKISELREIKAFDRVSWLTRNKLLRGCKSNAHYVNIPFWVIVFVLHLITSCFLAAWGQVTFWPGYMPPKDRKPIILPLCASDIFAKSATACCLLTTVTCWPPTMICCRSTLVKTVGFTVERSLQVPQPPQPDTTSRLSKTRLLFGLHIR